MEGLEKNFWIVEPPSVGVSRPIKCHYHQCIVHRPIRMSLLPRLGCVNLDGCDVCTVVGLGCRCNISILFLNIEKWPVLRTRLHSEAVGRGAFDCKAVKISGVHSPYRR